jgi:transposase
MRLADRGYDAGWIRTLVNAQGAFNIPPQRNRREPICFSPPLYRARNCIERFFNKIKHGRRIDTTTGARRRSWLLDLIAIEVEIRKVAPTCVCTLTICGLFFPSLPAQPHPPFAYMPAPTSI